MEIILASGSPRRRELLEMIGLRFETVPALEEEAQYDYPPELTVQKLSEAKALEVSKRLGEGKLYIAADTLVCAGGRVLGKPRDKADAAAMLRLLSGRAHSVYTGVTLISGGRILTQYEESIVHFRELSDSEITSYLDRGESMDKAGAYGIQGLAGLFIQGIEGDFYNVMGLPLCRLYKMLLEFGVKLL